MKPELEALVLAFDAVRQARTGEDARRLEAIYRAKLDDVLARHPGVSLDALTRAVNVAHRRWVLAQKKPSTLPPKA
ncbi:MAG TPA: hypothetical protein VI454_15490 [Verrucomicrobiae bacterium]|jgi:hypothetical protein